MVKLTRKSKWLLIFLLGGGLMIACVPLAIWLTHSQSAQLGNQRARCELKQQKAHLVAIHNDRFVPAQTNAKLCDTLTITNRDAHRRLIAFGQHDSHISYDGVSERLLGQNESLKVALINPGTYLLHDHANEAIKATFLVRR